MCLNKSTWTFTQGCCDSAALLKNALQNCGAVMIGAGAGLSASAGFEYGGARFEKYFADFHDKYGITDMYLGGFFPFKTGEEFWAFWSRLIYVNRYTDAPNGVYDDLLRLVKDKDYFVLTTNVDHCFQKAGFDKDRLFYTQGDYGLWQCSEPCHYKTYDNESQVRSMLARQKQMKIPSELIPYCPVCGAPMTMNLRSDDTFVQDEGWYAAAERFEAFADRHKKGNVLFLELGVGGDTPEVIKHTFRRMARQNKNSLYVCVNTDKSWAEDSREREIYICEDIAALLKRCADGK